MRERYDEDVNKYDLLLNYKQYPSSKSCYLDGRYFNMVFKDEPGLITEPLHIHIEENKFNMFLPYTNINKDDVGLLRVIVTTPTMRHSMLVIFDHENKEGWVYNPDVHHPELNELLVNNIISYLSNFLDYDYYEVEGIEYKEKKTLNCKQSGVCTALTIMYALFFLEGLPFTNKSVQDVRKFMTAIESNYDLPMDGVPDIEYLTQGQAIGTGAGAIIGGLALSPLGPGGVILGAAGGGLLGYGIGSSF